MEFDLEKFAILDVILNKGKNYKQSVFREKLGYIMKHFNIDKYELAKAANHSHIGIESLLKKSEDRDDDAPPLITIEGLANNLNINPNWLIYGEGEMFKEGTNINSNNNVVSNSRTKDINQTQGSLSTNTNTDASKDVLIESLKRENELLHSQLERANKTIDMLEGLIQKK